MSSSIPHAAIRTADINGNEILLYSGVRYLTRAMLGPWDTSKILQQISYLPGDDYLRKTGQLTPMQSTQFQDADLDEAEEDSLHSFEDFGDSDDVASRQDSDEDSVHLPPTYIPPSIQAPTDDQGYLIRTSYDELDPTRPPYQIPPQQGGLLDTAGAVMVLPHESIFSLWKGQYTAWLGDMIDMILQPTIEGLLNDIFHLPDESIPLVHLDNFVPNLTTLVLSHVLSGIVTAPLDLVRTRLIAQTWAPNHRKYAGTTDALSRILSEEGWNAFYGQPNLTATILLRTVRSLCRGTSSLIMDRVFKVSSEDNPIGYALTELGLTTGELLLTLPLETIRRRLQVQNHSRVRPSQPFETIVEVRNQSYAGVWDCLCSIIEEEGGRRSRKRLRRASIINGAPSVERSGTLVRRMGDESRPWWDGFGLKGLYRGLKAHLWANVGMLVVSTLQLLPLDPET